MISVVCPFFNEKENLEELYSRLIKAVGKLQDDWEMIFVNDGSQDGGGEYLRSLARDGRVGVIELDRNYGLTTALFAGLQASRGEIVVTLDADLQNPPEEIPRLVGLLGTTDMVTGIRRNRHDPWLRRISGKIANQIRRTVVGDHIEDVGCSLRVFRRAVLEAFYPYQGMHRFFPGVAEFHGFKVTQVPVEHHERRRGKAKYGLGNRIFGPLWDLFAVHWLVRRKIRYKIRSTSVE